MKHTLQRSKKYIIIIANDEIVQVLGEGLRVSGGELLASV